MTMQVFSLEDVNPDWHDTYSVKLGELVAEGFDPFGDEDWPSIDWYSSEQRARVEHKFLRRYRYYELGIMPPLVWRDMLTSKMLEIAPKYKPAYAKLAAGADVLADSDEYGKRREVFSDFPATQISPTNQDYASTANDQEYETVTDGPWMDKISQLRDYNDIDVLILDELGTLFSALATVEAPW